MSGDNRIAVFHNFDQYCIPKDDLMGCFYMIDPSFACEIDIEQNTIEWWGKITRIDESPWLFFTQCDIPSVAEANDVYPIYLESKRNQRLSRTSQQIPSITHQDQRITELSDTISSLLQMTEALNERIKSLETTSTSN